jgi:predicted ester cyclase
MSGPHIMVSNENIRHLIDQAIEAFNARDLNGWMNFYAEDALHFQPNRTEPLREQAEIREDYLASTWIPFPDFHFQADRAFGEGSWVCVEGIFTGTHWGNLSGLGGEVIAPTHKSVRIPLCLVVKLEEGKAVEVHEYNDQLRFLAQLGLAP